MEESEWAVQNKFVLVGDLGVGGDNKYNWTLDGVVYITHRKTTHWKGDGVRSRAILDGFGVKESFLLLPGFEPRTGQPVV